jgi:hypothetical protein
VLEPLPDEIYEERGRILEMVKFISGIGDIGVGEKPEGVSSGRGFLVLQEAVDSIIMPTLLAFENCKEEVARRMLVLAQRYYTEERTIRVKGERGKWTVKPFKGSDLIEGLDVRVVTGSSFPWSKSARTDVVLSILQSLPELANNDQGLPDAGKVARMLEQGGVGVFEAENDPDTQEVEREHGLFEAFNPDEGIWRCRSSASGRTTRSIWRCTTGSSKRATCESPTGTRWRSWRSRSTCSQRPRRPANRRVGRAWRSAGRPARRGRWRRGSSRPTGKGKAGLNTPASSGPKLQKGDQR